MRIVVRSQPTFPPRLQRLLILIAEEEERDSVQITGFDFKQHAVDFVAVLFAEVADQPLFQRVVVGNFNLFKVRHDSRHHLAIDTGQIVEAFVVDVDPTQATFDMDFTAPVVHQPTRDSQAVGECPDLRLPGFREGLSLVVDFRASETPISGTEVRELAEFARRADAKWGTTKWSFIASDDMTFGLSRIFMALTSEHQVETHVFRNIHDANGWLGLGVEMNEILLRTPD